MIIKRKSQISLFFKTVVGLFCLGRIIGPEMIFYDSKNLLSEYFMVFYYETNFENLFHRRKREMTKSGCWIKFHYSGGFMQAESDSINYKGSKHFITAKMRNML